MMSDQTYLEIFLTPIRKSKNYHPKFGVSKHSQGISLSKFHQIYGADPFYSWIGLDNDLVYAAHRAAGGMTSLYRQIGIGCENLFRQIIINQAQYENISDALWSYKMQTPSGKTKTLKLDARLEFSRIQQDTIAKHAREWTGQVCLMLDAERPSRGIVFEVRQGYKSKDSKRQNADIDNAAVAWSKGYLPVFAISSGQIDSDMILRYRNNRSSILTGIPSDNPAISLYAFTNQVLGYDLAAFFSRNSVVIRQTVNDVIQTLLSAA
ncbi:MAG TPA: hypothetical protein EYH05_02575 [Anaerolineae bacterium]|nr:hypothetical protein [Anaerolineae bacterium]